MSSDLVDFYHYGAKWSPDDKAYIAYVAEWPSLKSHGDSVEAAIKELKGVVKSCIEDMQKKGEKIPPPLDI